MLNIRKHNGSTRLVFLIGKYAFKLPSIYSWKNFLNGLLANIQEREFSGLHSIFCPVVFSFPLGILNVMLRAEPLPVHMLGQALDVSFVSIEFEVPVEYKHSSFGILNGKIVAIDYGTPVCYFPT